MKKNLLRILGVTAGLIGIVVSIVLLNTFLNNLKSETYELQIVKNAKVINNVNEHYLSEMEVTYNTLVNNNMIKSLKEKEYLNSNNNLSIEYIVTENTPLITEGYKTFKDGVFFTKFFNVEGSTDYIQMKVSLNTINQYVMETYNKEFVYILNESFLNDLNFNNKVKNYQPFINNKLIKKNAEEKNINLIISNFEQKTMNQLKEKGYISNFSQFYTQESLKDITKNEVGEILVIENSLANGSTKNSIEILEKMSQTIMLSVMILLMSGALLLY